MSKLLFDRPYVYGGRKIVAVEDSFITYIGSSVPINF